MKNRITKEIANSLEVHSEGDNGRLYIDSGGDLYISTTSLLSLYEDKTGLEAWKQKIGEEEANRIRDEAANRGTLVHSDIENYLENGSSIEFLPINNFSKNAINGFYKDINMVSIEEAVAFNDGDVRFAGRFDQLVHVPDSTFTILDSNNHIPEGYYICDLKTKLKAPQLKLDYIFKHLLQSSAYVIAKETLDNIRLDGVIIVFSSPRSCKKIYISRDKVDYYWSVFHDLLRDYYKIQSLDRDWNYYIAQAEYKWNDLHLCFESMSFEQFT